MTLVPRREMARKALHLLFAAVPISLAVGVARAPIIGALAIMLMIAIALEVARARSPVVAQAFSRTVGPLLRDRERDGHRMQWTGATWLIVVSVAAVWLLPRPDAIAVTWAVTVGDASAALIGVILGGRLLPRPSHKSFEGSTACFAATFAGAYGLAGLSVPLALVVGAAATAAEWPRSTIDDNARIGAATAAVLIIASLFAARPWNTRASDGAPNAAEATGRLNDRRVEP
jgi:dolichol kinase